MCCVATHEGSLIVCWVSTGILAQPTLTFSPGQPARADLVFHVGLR